MPSISILVECNVVGSNLLATKFPPRATPRYETWLSKIREAQEPRGLKASAVDNVAARVHSLISSTSF